MTRLLALISTAAFLAVLPAYAADEHGHDHLKGHEHGAAEKHFDVKVPDTVKDAWALLSAKLAELDAAVAAKAFDAAHPASEHIEAAVHTLQTKPELVSAENKPKLTSALKQLDKTVDDLHHSVEEKSAEEITAAAGKIKKLLPLIESLYPAGTLK